MPLIYRYPCASLIGLLQKIRQTIKIDNLFFNGYSLPPSGITIESTYKCNLRCVTCWFYGNKGIMNDKEMNKSLSYNQLKSIADNLAFYKPYIYITGGEPLINKDVLKFIRYAKKRGFIVGIVTNGTILSVNNAKKIIESGLDFITVSIDGPEKIHNKIRGSNCFKKSIEGINNVIRFRDKKNYPIVTLNCTISDYNYLHLEEVVEIGEKNKVDIVALQHPCFLRKKTIERHHRIFKKIFKESDKLIDGYENDSTLKIDLKKLSEILYRIKKNKYNVSLRFYQDFNNNQIMKYYSTEKAINKNCINPWYSATIKPNGDVTPCLGYTVGNINNDRFLKIWNNKKFKFFRRMLKKYKYYPACIRCCGFFFNWKR